MFKFWKWILDVIEFTELERCICEPLYLDAIEVLEEKTGKRYMLERCGHCGVVFRVRELECKQES